MAITQHVGGYDGDGGWTLASAQMKATIKPSGVTVAKGNVVQFDMTAANTGISFGIYAPALLPKGSPTDQQRSYAYDSVSAATTYQTHEQLTVGGVVVGNVIKHSKRNASEGRVSYEPLPGAPNVEDNDLVTGSSSGIVTTASQDASRDFRHLKNHPFNLVRREIGGIGLHDQMVFGIAQQAGGFEDAIDVVLVGITRATCFATTAAAGTVTRGDFCAPNTAGNGLLIRKAVGVANSPGISPVARAMENCKERLQCTRVGPDVNGPFLVGETLTGAGGESATILEVFDPDPAAGAPCVLVVRLETATSTFVETFNGVLSASGGTSGAGCAAITATAAPTLVMFNGLWGIGATGTFY